MGKNCVLVTEALLRGKKSVLVFLFLVFLSRSLKGKGLLGVTATHQSGQAQVKNMKLCSGVSAWKADSQAVQFIFVAT